MEKSESAPADKFDFDQANLAAPGPDMRDLVNSLANDGYVGTQKRASPRHRITMEVAAVPLDELLRPIGDPFIALTRDISAGGISLVHTRRVAAPYLLLKLDNGGGVAVRVITKVLRCRQLKRFFEVAGKFVSRCTDSNGEGAAGPESPAAAIPEHALPPQ